ncbi:hypothetical protein EB155_09730 [archaeon]|jgi:hypothetical protein|nr:hypothetical protein [archaeon]
MANALLSKTYSGGDNYTTALSDASVYTAPANTTSIIIGFTISNLTTGFISTTVKVYDSDANQTVHFLKDIILDTGSTLEIMGGNKMILNANDSILISSDSSYSFDTVLSLVEQT